MSTRFLFIFSLFFIIGQFLSQSNASTINDNYAFKRIDASNGLISNNITTIFKDMKGFVWIGTSSGLSRYDGHHFVNLTHDVFDSLSIKDNYIVDIQEDIDGNLWIETRWNYVVYDSKNEVFINDISIINVFFDGKVNIDDQLKIRIDENKDFWIITSDNKIVRFDHTSHEVSTPLANILDSVNDPIIDFQHVNNDYWILHSSGEMRCFEGKSFLLKHHYKHKFSPTTSDDSNGRFFIDADGDIWVYGMYKGILFYSQKQSKWSNYSTSSAEITLSSDIVRQVIQDNNGLFWIGTDHGGIQILTKQSHRVIDLKTQKSNLKSLSQNSITSLYCDDLGIVWIGTFKRGVCLYHESIYKFPHINNVDSDPSSLPYSDVNCFVEDKLGNLWIGTNGGGLVFQNKRTQAYKVYKHKEGANSISSDVVVNMFMDKDNILWIGTYEGGLNRFDGEKFKTYVYNSEDSTSLPNNSIWTIIQDKRDRLWIGTLGGGVALFDCKKDKFITVPNSGNVDLPSQYVSSIKQLRNGQIMIGTALGIIFYDVDNECYRYHPNLERSSTLDLNNKNVNDVYEDSRGLLWFATREGLNLYDPYNDFLKVFRKRDGLSEDMIDCILEDNDRHIWVSKGTGISRIFITTDSKSSELSFEILNFTENDGLQGNSFNVNACAKLSTGELLFGGSNGFNRFNPLDIKYNTNIPKVVFTDFYVFNKQILPSQKVKGRVILQKSVVETDYIRLPYSINVFSIEFAALNYFIPEKVKYRYKMEGFDIEWMDVDEYMSKVTYTNLNPGTYRLLVKARNNDGVWNDNPSVITIEVLPPFYVSPIAIVIYVFLFIALLVFARSRLLRKERLRFELKQERDESKRNRELDEMKLRFLTNISHEFRTPLTLILTPVEKVLKDTNNEQVQKSLSIVYSNAQHLLHLVNQLLDFRKLDLHGLRYNPSYGDGIDFLSVVANNFTESFSKKDVRYTFESSVKQLNFFFDKDKLQKILMNLVSNALKFTPEGGEVKILVDSVIQPDTKDDFLRIQVSDTGIGILEDEVDKIFERFYQTQHAQALGHSGSGIGLNLTREMVQLHGGDIQVESNPGKGTVFTVWLPIHEEETTLEIEHLIDEVDAIDEEVVGRDLGKQKITILVIEDNSDFRSFMKDTLSERYHVIEAGDGEEGLALIYDKLPDLIVSDVMMPRLDGMQLCKKIKSDVRTSHIPLILLTARSADEDKIRGFEIGADDYITKPFNMDLLLLRIQNQVEKRLAAQKSFRKNMAINPAEVEISSLEEKLIKKAIKLVEDNIADSKFSVEDLSRELGMSRVYLYKKMLAITGKTPIEFMRIIRLKRAAQLLGTSQLTVAEIAYQVGFNSPRYFSKYFKEEFGKLPSVYAHEKDELAKKENGGDVPFHL